MLNSMQFSWNYYYAEIKENIGGDCLFDSGEDGEAINVMLPSQAITVLVVFISTSQCYIFGSCTSKYGISYGVGYVA